MNDGGGHGKLAGVESVEVSKIFVAWDEFFFEMDPFGRVYSGETDAVSTFWLGSVSDFCQAKWVLCTARLVD